jgi:hypothetical protein
MKINQPRIFADFHGFIFLFHRMGASGHLFSPDTPGKRMNQDDVTTIQNRALSRSV